MDYNLKLLQVYDKLERQIKAIKEEIKETATLLPDKGERGLKGDTGAPGPKGRDGKDGVDGKDGKDGKDGVDGEDGVSVVDADVDFDNKLRLTLSDGSIIDAGSINLEDAEIRAYVGGSGGSGGSAGVFYTQVTTTPYTVLATDLKEGHNIYGILTTEDAIVYLPAGIPPTKIVVISNETTLYNVTTIEETP